MKILPSKTSSAPHGPSGIREDGPVATVRTLRIGMILFPGLNQMDFTGPFEVLSRSPKATVHVLWKDLEPVEDMRGLRLLPQQTFTESPDLDVLHVPGGHGQEALMEDQMVLTLIKRHADSGKLLLSVGTGALICGAAGILHGRHATTHWTAHDLLGCFGAIAVDQRVVVDRNLVTTTGVSAGIDGAVRVAAMLRGEEVAQQIQLAMEYAPDPPFQSGDFKTAPTSVVDSALLQVRRIRAQRVATARRYADQLDAQGRESLSTEGSLRAIEG
jgi:cyclohexyl-isocyanide hydratase